MNFTEYQTAAIATRRASGSAAADAMYLAAKLPVEAAEAAQLVIKEQYHGADLNRAALAEELGDLLWYVANLADLYRIQLDSVAIGNIAKLRARHGDTYNAAHYTGGVNG